MAGPNRCKGIVFATFSKILEDTKGSDALRETLARPETREVADVLRHGGLIKTAWYPLEWYAGLHRAAIDVTGDSRLPFRVGKISTLDDFASGFMRVVLAIVSPQMLMAASAKVFNRYYEIGTMKVVEKGSGHARGTWFGCAGFDKNIWMDVFGGCEGALEVAGAKGFRPRLVAGGGDGDTSAEYEMVWT